MSHMRTDTTVGYCVLCVRQTDTGLAFEGPSEFVVAGLMHLGLKSEQAKRIVADEIPDDGKADVTVEFFLCQDCAVGWNLAIGPFMSGVPVHRHT